MHPHELVSEFKQVYSQLNFDTLDLLKSVYDKKIIFEDPLHHIEGLEQLRSYFEHMYQRVEHIQFDYQNEVIEENKATIIWAMHFKHPRIKKGRQVSVNGCTYLQFEDKVSYHRDYFDLGQMLYENITLIGPVISSIRKRAGNL
ncbi:MAG: nuclear transport factor 2 family protein [Pseudomonadota bacterium]